MPNYIGQWYTHVHIVLNLCLYFFAPVHYDTQSSTLQMCQMELSFWQLNYFELVDVHFTVALEYVDPKIRYRYPPCSAYDGNYEIRNAKISLQEIWH
jgi:hypothetical protein